MAVTFAVALRTCCVAVGLLVASARAAEPVSPLLGITRDQLLSRQGEPKSQIAVGDRVFFYYPREKIVLRNNVVVEVEAFAGESAAPPPAAPVAPNDASTSATRTTGAANPAAPPAAAPESKVEIKFVHAPSAKDGRAPESGKTAPVSTEPVPPPARVVPETVPPATSVPIAAAPERSAPAVQPSLPEVASGTAKSDGMAEKSAADELAAKKAKQDAVKAAPAKAGETPTPPTEDGISVRTYAIVLVAVVGGAGFLFWRNRQRQLELAASSVENTPLEAPSTTPKFSGNGFTAEVLNKLEWKQFEELVAAYYSKTGVVAVRTKAGPESPVHIKISWKGEPRPFAYVQCIAQPPGLIDPKPVQALIAALTTDDIRRGYIVTTGKFNVAARNLAEEKHLTILPGEVFLEKLNALPAGARTEIMQSISGDTPTGSA